MSAGRELDASWVQTDSSVTRAESEPGLYDLADS